MLFVPTSVAAQSDAHVAIGADVSKRMFVDDGFRQGVKPSLLYRIRRHRQPSSGWRVRIPQFGFNWFSADVDMPVGGQNTEIGHLNVRPFLAGVGETRVWHDGKDVPRSYQLCDRAARSGRSNPTGRIEVPLACGQRGVQSGTRRRRVLISLESRNGYHRFSDSSKWRPPAR